MAIRTRELAPDDWPLVEELFGANGACGGCWCMYWRVRGGEEWEAVKGAAAKRRLRALVEGGEALAVLAFDGELPVGWCTFGPRLSFPRLERARTLACDDAAAVWSLPCFFVRRGYRGRGVGSALLAAALTAMRRRGASTAEGYPVQPRRGVRSPDAFAWTGVMAMFERLGFARAGRAKASKVRVRRPL